jgi:hypothetical protein
MRRRGDLKLRNFSIDDILKVYQKKGYPIDKTKLMITGIRSNDKTPNIFNDAIIWIEWFNNAVRLKQAPATTDPGLYYLLNPCNVKGTAILPPGYYADLWELGLHKGKYLALVQASPVAVIRDADRDKELDYNAPIAPPEMIGLNCHHAGEDSIQVDRWSAACQVLKRLTDWDSFFADCKRKQQKRYSYGLLLESDFE